MRQRPNLAALTSVLLIVTIVLLPLTLTAMSVVQEATNLYERIEAGELDFGRFLSQLLDALPAWATDLLDRLGISDLGDLQARLSSALKEGSQFLATQAIAIGQGAAHIVVSFFLMLYLLFFFLRDGSELSQRLKDAIPLGTEQKRALFSKFTIVIRAMFKGTILVAALQGILGGIIFWFLGIPARGVMGRGDGLFVLIACGGFRLDMVAGRTLFAGDGSRVAGVRSDCLWGARDWLSG